MKDVLVRAAILAVTALLCGPVHGDHGLTHPAPSTVNYQGTLYNAQTGALEGGPKDLEFRVYATKDSPMGDAVWGESHTGVALLEGVFNVVLGAGDAIEGVPHIALDDVFAGEEASGAGARWFGVAVAGELEERRERQKFASAPYAFTASTAVFATHGVPAGVIAPWGGGAITPETLDGWVACDGRPLDATAEDGKYWALWLAIGDTWGGTGEKDFWLPNLGGRALMGDTAGGGGISPRALSDRLGEEEHALLESEMPFHGHSYQDYYSSDVHTIQDSFDTWAADDTTADVSPKPSTYDTLDGSDAVIHIGNAGKATAHQNMQPSVVVNFIIKY